MTQEKVPVSVIVPTLDEEPNLSRCLKSVSPWSDEIIIVDSGSTDATIRVAREFTDHVHHHNYENAPRQWKWILENVELSNEWVLALDADYAVTPELAADIRSALNSVDAQIDGFYVRHKQIFRGKFIRHGGIYPRYRLCLFRKSAVFVDDHDLVDNRFYTAGLTSRLESDVVEDNRKEVDLSVWMHKQIEYAQRAAQEEAARKSERGKVDATWKRGRNERVLWLKTRWAGLPKYWRSVGYFLYRYILRLGFLDGKEGFLYHFSQALVFRVMLDARVEELDKKTLPSR